MTGRERFYKAISFSEPDRPPHSELIFDLCDDAFGFDYATEEEMAAATGSELDRLLHRTAEAYALLVEKYGWDFILEWRPARGNEAQFKFLPMLKELVGKDVVVGSHVWGACICIDTISDCMQFSIDLHERPETLHELARGYLNNAIRHADRLIDAGCEVVCVASDLAFNAGPFLSPKHFAEFCAPYLHTVIQHIKDRGVTAMLHTDGNLMPIMDQIIDIRPHILQSIDPMAGMDIKEVKRLTYGKLAIMGNVQCSLLQDGPDEKIIESAKYCIDHAAPGGGYIFSSSNSIFKGLPLRNYEVMLNYFWSRFAK